MISINSSSLQGLLMCGNVVHNPRMWDISPGHWAGHTGLQQLIWLTGQGSVAQDQVRLGGPRSAVWPQVRLGSMVTKVSADRVTRLMMESWWHNGFNSHRVSILMGATLVMLWYWVYWAVRTFGCSWLTNLTTWDCGTDLGPWSRTLGPWTQWPFQTWSMQHWLNEADDLFSDPLPWWTNKVD